MITSAALLQHIQSARSTANKFDVSNELLNELEDYQQQQQYVYIHIVAGVMYPQHIHTNVINACTMMTDLYLVVVFSI